MLPDKYLKRPVWPFIVANIAFHFSYYSDRFIFKINGLSDFWLHVCFSIGLGYALGEANAESWKVEGSAGGIGNNKAGK
jgi:hypothetical protein